jgi:RNA polymerase sigma-70 factor (ECF subfamily)
MNETLSIAGGRSYADRLVEYLAPSADEDAALARRIVAAAPGRDDAAEAELCRRFAPRVRLYGLRHLRSEAAAADLIQDVLMMTLQKLRAGAVREPERLASFVLGTCRQMVIDWRRSGARRERILGAFTVDLPSLTEDSPDALDAERLRLCLQRLPERERTVLMMTFYDDRPADAVALDLGISAGNVVRGPGNAAPAHRLLAGRAGRRAGIRAGGTSLQLC